MVTLNSDKLRRVRKDRSLSQTEAALRVGITPQKLYNYETGRAKPPADVLLSLLLLYKAKPIDLVSRSIDQALSF